VWVTLRDAGFAEGVSVELSADRESCTVTRVEVANIIDGGRQWYSWLYIQGAWLLLLAILWFVCMGAVSAALLSAYLPGQLGRRSNRGRDKRIGAWYRERLRDA
jgi:hypothetical protein